MPPKETSRPTGYDQLNAIDAEEEEYETFSNSAQGNVSVDPHSKSQSTHIPRLSVVTTELLPAPPMHKSNALNLSPKSLSPFPQYPNKPSFSGAQNIATSAPLSTNGLLPSQKAPDQLTHFGDLESQSDRESQASHATWMGVFSRLGHKISTALPKRAGPAPKADRPVEIYYSVFKNLPEFEARLEDTSTKDYEATIYFGDVVEAVIEAIGKGIYPSLIAQGSSGSYFAYDENSLVLGVFKPKDEEPYGPLSPKWTKWLHRNLFPCFFGRSCLIPNTGYICEAAASLLDRRLQTNIVPHTEIVWLSSPTFYYRFFERRRAKNDARLLPRKPGSFQLFLHDYEQADVFFRKHPWPEKTPRCGYGATSEHSDSQFVWTPAVQKQFRLELEKLVILDYIMRNTDRGLDNWMIHLEWVEETGSPSRGSTTSGRVPKLTIGAIDSGLSWPWKHPDEWRSYPFGWLFLPLDLIGQPFSRETREHFLPLLTSSSWWEQSSMEFRDMFSLDPDFRERMWKKQWAVMKGQAFNVVETLKAMDQGPLELARRDKVLIFDGEMDIPVRIPIETLNSAIGTPLLDQMSVSSRPSSRPPSRPASGMVEDENLLLPALNSLSASPMKNSPRNSTNFSSFGNSGNFATSANSSRIVSTPTDDTTPLITKQRNPSHKGSSLSLEARYRELESSSPRKTHGRRQSLWDELISEHSTTGPIKTDKNDRSESPVNDVGFRHAESHFQATRRVIVERLQIATRKSPFFSWC